MGQLDRLIPRTHIAYFSMEIALAPEIHTYSGGLGVVAGDAVRSCADLELPAVFVTLLSRGGYLRQEIGQFGAHEQDAQDVYHKLETVILPLYHGDRAAWIWMMKEAISKIAYYFKSQRMMRRYASEAYIR